MDPRGAVPRRMRGIAERRLNEEELKAKKKRKKKRKKKTKKKRKCEANAHRAAANFRAQLPAPRREWYFSRMSRVCMFLPLLLVGLLPAACSSSSPAQTPDAPVCASIGIDRFKELL